MGRGAQSRAAPRDLRFGCRRPLCASSAGCRLDMHIQPKYSPLDPSNFFGDGRSERPVVPGTVAHGRLRTDELLYTGKLHGQDADVFPFPITRQVLERGRERFNIYCTPCHDYTGSGKGLVARAWLSRSAFLSTGAPRKSSGGALLRCDDERLRCYVQLRFARDSGRPLGHRRQIEPCS